MELLTDRLKLIQLTLDDLDEVHALHSIPAVDEFNTLGIPESKQETSSVLLTWLDNQAAVPRKSFVYCVRLLSTNQFVGLIALNLGKVKSKIAEVWYKTHPDHWGVGYTSEALNEVLRFGFNDLGLHRIEAGCAVDNAASIRVLEKGGMTREGRKRKILPIRGQWVDNYFYSILEEEFIVP